MAHLWDKEPDTNNPGVLKLFSVATLFKIFSNFHDPRILQTTII
jgi:hypothetical protein